MTDDKHIAEVFHIEGSKVSHVDSFEIVKFSGCMSRIYGGLIVHRIKCNDCLVMDLNYIEKGIVNFSMIRYL